MFAPNKTILHSLQRWVWLPPWCARCPPGWAGRRWECCRAPAGRETGDTTWVEDIDPDEHKVMMDTTAGKGVRSWVLISHRSSTWPAPQTAQKSIKGIQNHISFDRTTKRLFPLNLCQLDFFFISVFVLYPYCVLILICGGCSVRRALSASVWWCVYIVFLISVLSCIF